MRNTIVLIGMLLVAVPVQAAQPTYDPESTADKLMEIKDLDRNGSIDAAEFERPALHKFQSIDKDGNGLLSANEMFEDRYAGRPEMNIKTPKVRQQIVKNMMKRWDRNGDMQISKDEKLRFVRSEFAVIDRDQDALITRDELVAHWQRKKNEMERARGQNKDDD